MIRFGLCCIFREAPIKFRRTTATYLQRMPTEQQLVYIAEICRHNAQALLAALTFCRDNSIQAFRINSQILPLKTHPDVGYAMTDLPDGRQIVAAFRKCGAFARTHGIRTSFHPDQFIVLSAFKQDVVDKAVADLRYQAEVADWVNADVINIHGGGAYGDKKTSLKRLAANIEKLPEGVHSRLTLENDDRTYTPVDLYPVCKDLGIPLVYDVHHHRCLPDKWSVEHATDRALSTWDREPLFHLSSPLGGWKGADPKKHDDYIDIRDFPDCWRDLNITVDVEAKAKELAVLRLMRTLRKSGKGKKQKAD